MQLCTFPRNSFPWPTAQENHSHCCNPTTQVLEPFLTLPLASGEGAIGHCNVLMVEPFFVLTNAKTSFPTVYV